MANLEDFVQLAKGFYKSDPDLWKTQQEGENVVHKINQNALSLLENLQKEPVHGKDPQVDAALNWFKKFA